MAQPGLTKELKRYADFAACFASRCATRAYGHFFPPVAMEQPTPELFNEEVDSEDEGWTEVADLAQHVRAERDQDIIRLAQEGGPLRQILTDVQHRSLEIVLRNAGLAGDILRRETNSFVTSTGQMSNCDAINDLFQRLMHRYPYMRLAKSAVSELKASFVEGRMLANERRRVMLQYRGLPPPTMDGGGGARGEVGASAGRREDRPETTNTSIRAVATGCESSDAPLSRVRVPSKLEVAGSGGQQNGWDGMEDVPLDDDDDEESMLASFERLDSPETG